MTLCALYYGTSVVYTMKGNVAISKEFCWDVNLSCKYRLSKQFNTCIQTSQGRLMLFTKKLISPVAIYAKLLLLMHSVCPVVDTKRRLATGWDYVFLFVNECTEIFH